MRPLAAELLNASLIVVHAAYRSRTLYAYEAQRPEDLAFPEDAVVLAHPAKDENDGWWFGSLVMSGAKGWFPSSYVEPFQDGEHEPLFSTSRPHG